MGAYLVGSGFIILGVWHLLYTRHIIKNRIEVDALVIHTEEGAGGDSGSLYYPVFRYNINGEQFETKYSTGNPKYSPGVVTRIYCYKKNPRRIILSNHILISIVGDILLMAFGIVFICIFAMQGG